MATVLCHVNIVSRGKGHSAVGGAAYRAREKIKNEYDGKIHNYKNRHDLVYAEILKPYHAPDWVLNRIKLWNEVEKIEKRYDAQLARQIEIALPRELTKEQYIEMAREYAKEFVEKGMVADLCIHDSGDGNPHAHIMLTMRPFKRDGTWGEKAKIQYVLDEQGSKIKLPSGGYKSKRINTTDWDKRENVEEWRELYATIVNKYLERYGHEQRIDYRSFERQGRKEMPMERLTRDAWEKEHRGFETEQGNRNRERKAFNKELAELEEQRHYLQEIERLKSERQERERQAEQGKKREEAHQPQQAQPQEKSLEQMLVEAQRELEQELKQIVAEQKKDTPPTPQPEKSFEQILAEAEAQERQRRAQEYLKQTSYRTIRDRRENLPGWKHKQERKALEEQERQKKQQKPDALEKLVKQETPMERKEREFLELFKQRDDEHGRPPPKRELSFEEELKEADRKHWEQQEATHELSPYEWVRRKMEQRTQELEHERKQRQIDREQDHDRGRER